MADRLLMTSLRCPSNLVLQRAACCPLKGARVRLRRPSGARSFLPAAARRCPLGWRSGAVTVCTPAVLPGSSPLLQGHPLERRVRATRRVLEAQILALKPERDRRGLSRENLLLTQGRQRL